MGIIGHGYGSEFHLLRYLGDHRHLLNREIEKETGARVLNWLDSKFDGRRKFPHLDEEWKGADFLDGDTAPKESYSSFWPQTGNPPNWDGIGLLQCDNSVEFLLVEAKAHVSEMQSSCSASPKGGLDKIKEAFDYTISAYNFRADPEKWLSPYYQKANRLAHLHFFLQNNIHARLVFIYFGGDSWPDNGAGSGAQPICPKNRAEWEPHIEKMNQHLGLTGQSKLEARVHNVYLPV